MMRLKLFVRSGLVGAVLLALSSGAALADRGDRYDRSHKSYWDNDTGRNRDDRNQVRIGLSIGDRPQLMEERTTRVWIEPEYRTVYNRVWVEPVFREEYDRVWVPDRFEVREVVVWDCGRRTVRRDRVLVQPAHYDDVYRRAVVCPGRWESVARLEQVCAGHWETRTERVPVADRGGFNLDIFATMNR
jgi:hypothetical protein